MRRAVIVILILCLGVASCQPMAPELTDADRQAISADIEAEAQAWLEALLARDIERWSSLLRRDGLEWVINGNLRESYEQVTTNQARTFSESWARAEGDWDGRQVRVLSSDAAVFRGSCHATVERTSGETSHYPKIFFTLLYERVDTGWKVSYIHESFDRNTVETTPPAGT